MKLPATPTLNEEGAAYYAWARAALHSHKFGSTTERELWGLHAEGHSYADMSERTGMAKTVLFSLVKRIKSELQRKGNKGNQGNVTLTGRKRWQKREAMVSRAMDDLLELLTGTATKTKPRRSLEPS